MTAGVHPIRLGYVLVFAATALVCFGAVARARDRIEDRDTRWGLTALLATSGAWSAFHVGRIAAPLSLPAVKLTFYILGLTMGLATVGAWLYFCSAYAGESYHRQSFFRRLAVGVYLPIVTIKLTNPLHGLYFSASTIAVPFPHLAVRLGILHWIVTGLAYALSAIGFYVLFDLFADSNYATTRLSLLVGLAGLPVVFDLVAYADPDAIITLNYEPIGVALFALGVLYVADGSFVAVRQFGREQLVDELDEAIVILDSDGTVRDVNTAATELFPALADGVGEPIATVAPAIDAYLPVEEPRVVEREVGDATRYYLLSTRQLTVGRTTVGRAVVFTDVTEVERQRQEIDRQRAQLDDFAEAIAHELRNTLNILHGHLELVDARLDPDGDVSIAESLGTATGKTDRMMRIVDDLSTLARYGQPVEDPTVISVGLVAETAWEKVATDGATLSVVADGSIRADRPRLEKLFENLFRFAIANGATRIELERTDDGLVVTDDGAPIADADGERAFAYGDPVPDAGSGTLLPVVRTLVEAHGWTVATDTDYPDGVRIRVTE